MMQNLIRFFCLVAVLTLPSVAMAQVEVVLTNSDPVVAVHSNFRGQAVTLFGTIDPPPDPGGSYSVVVVVQGPSTDWVVREKRRQFGLVLNAASARYDRVPSYYGIFSTNPLSQMVDAGLAEQAHFDLAALAATLRADDGTDFDPQFLRLMQKAGRFSVADRGVVMLSRSAFSARVPIASNATNGLYLARAFVIENDEIVSTSATHFTVRTQGFERYVAEVARSAPMFYGLATILVAIATGWLGGVLFRR